MSFHIHRQLINHKSSSVPYVYSDYNHLQSLSVCSPLEIDLPLRHIRQHIDDWNMTWKTISNPGMRWPTIMEYWLVNLNGIICDYLYIFYEYLAIVNLVIELTTTLLSKSWHANKLNLLIHSIIMIFYLNLPNDFFQTFFFPFRFKLFLMVLWYFLLMDLYAIFFYDILYSDPRWRY
jgi:hypothetical protein